MNLPRIIAQLQWHIHRGIIFGNRHEGVIGRIWDWFGEINSLIQGVLLKINSILNNWLWLNFLESNLKVKRKGEKRGQGCWHPATSHEPKASFDQATKGDMVTWGECQWPSPTSFTECLATLDPQLKSDLWPTICHLRQSHDPQLLASVDQRLTS